MDTSKILLVEDEENIARFIKLELNHEGYKTDIATDGLEGISKVKENNYNLVILDIMLPGINGIEVCRQVRQFSSIPIIMLTAKDDIYDKISGLDSGADDYITKPFVIEELFARVRANLRRRTLDNHVATLKVKDLIMDLEKHQVARNGKIIELRKKEYNLLECLIRNKDIVLSRDQILEKVWGYEYAGDTNIVDVYIRYLRSKIDDSYKDKLIYTVRGVGYMIMEYSNED
ncbi:response regulator transcription factor [Clostridium magnum]|uniref:Stage 0 sporulation protein A homolog n=1 Tax=Clostridium magnum DSM 2767 TaxID=1121326 RepID=A0A161XD17_9CLOT|nr:response regulator transcription factor [Clostridium magnum]KZL92226.1 response regulator ArlR [Clostridium magnum DSM 2767]SHH17218.1 DNA-binding response regulator, OmpR family, contains REC and winged-helix (wHTH) domain [Clostridium magnum DSM 2767]